MVRTDPSSSSPPLSSDSSPPASGGKSVEPGDVSGRHVVLWLFAALSVATALALLYFATLAPASARPRIYGALAGNLALPVVAWFLFTRIAKTGANAKRGIVIEIVLIALFYAAFVWLAFGR